VFGSNNGQVAGTGHVVVWATWSRWPSNESPRAVRGGRGRLGARGHAPGISRSVTYCIVLVPFAARQKSATGERLESWWEISYNGVIGCVALISTSILHGRPPMPRLRHDDLTPEQQGEAERLFEAMRQATEDELWQIQRLKLSGMRWGCDGADAVCHLRALYEGEKDQWEAFWDQTIN
jgi:hypothetical protein